MPGQVMGQFDEGGLERGLLRCQLRQRAPRVAGPARDVEPPFGESDPDVRSAVRDAEEEASLVRLDVDADRLGRAVLRGPRAADGCRGGTLEIPPLVVRASNTIPLSGW